MLPKARFLIRTRILVLGAVIAAFIASVPVFFHREMARIAHLYQTTMEQHVWLDRSYELDSLLFAAKDGIARYAGDPTPENKSDLDAKVKLLDQKMESLDERAFDGRLQNLVSQLHTSYKNWKRVTLDSATAHLSYSSGSDALAESLLAVSASLRENIEQWNQSSYFSLFVESQSYVRKLSFASVVFFVVAALLITSLWFTVIPKLSALLLMIQEFQIGHYEKRIRVKGRSEVSDIVEAFNEMAERVQASTRQKDEFVSTVSHELRTPLTAIRGAVGLLLGGVMGELPHDAEDLLRVTEKNVDRLGRLIAGILDMAKIEAGVFKLEFEKVDLANTVEQVVSYLKPLASAQMVNILWQRPAKTPLVVIDRDRIEQVLINLLSNAIKFCGKNGKVTLALETDLQNHRVRVHVADNGQGIPAEFQERIFKKFQQIESSLHKNKEGSGLGLAIARAIVEEHQGHIGVNSAVGNGSDFWFDLPWNGKDFSEAAPANAA